VKHTRGNLDIVLLDVVAQVVIIDTGDVGLVHHGKDPG
jgi:hypothetical protein